MLSFIAPWDNENFVKNYNCFSVSCHSGDRMAKLENGGKIIMPPSALSILTQQHIEYPMLFKLTNNANNRFTHCGVLEFVAQEGHIYIPYWMMSNLDCQEGSVVQVSYVKLPIATFALFQPITEDFMQLTSPKAVLETIFRNFACLTKDDKISIRHINNEYLLRVLELKPANAVSIIECDMSVDFAPPLGCEEPKNSGTTRSSQQSESDEDNDLMTGHTSDKFQLFAGAGQRLDGKPQKQATSAVSCNKSSAKSFGGPVGIPEYDYKPGSLYFIRNFSNQSESEDSKDDGKPFVPFQGQGTQLKPSKKR